jgi:hypothetical protein
MRMCIWLMAFGVTAGCVRTNKEQQDRTTLQSQVTPAVGKSPTEHRAATKMVNLNLDKEAAVRIAEIVLVKVYGPNVLDERPWEVSEDDAGFVISGTLHTAKGGVARIEISRATGCVLSYTHGK